MAVVWAISPTASRLLSVRIETRPKRGELESNLLNLARLLEESSDSVRQIEEQLESRKRRVEQLQHDAETAQGLLNLTDEQRKAMAFLLNSELQRAGKKSLWQGALVNGVFFILGFVVQWILSALF